MDVCVRMYEGDKYKHAYNDIPANVENGKSYSYFHSPNLTIADSLIYLVSIFFS